MRKKKNERKKDKREREERMIRKKKKKNIYEKLELLRTRMRENSTKNLETTKGEGERAKEEVKRNSNEWRN